MSGSRRSHFNKQVVSSNTMSETHTQDQADKARKNTDLLAIIFTVLLSVPVGGICSYILTLAAGKFFHVDVTGFGTLVFGSAMLILFPLWFWLALKLRRLIDWPKNAFQSDEAEGK